MSCKVIIDDFTQDEWTQQADVFLDNNIYQSWAYQKIRAENEKQDLKQVMVRNDNGDAVLMFQMRIKRIKLLGLKIGYVQSGPLMLRKDGNQNDLAKAVNLLQDIFSTKMINVLRINPNIFDDQYGKEIANILISNKFEKVTHVSPYHTIRVSLKESEDEIRSRFHRDWRRLLRKAEKVDFQIKEETGSEFFGILESLYFDAKKRKGFTGVDPTIFRKTQEIILPELKSKLIIAYLNGEPVTAHATTHFGNMALPILIANRESGLKQGSAYLGWWITYQMAKKSGMDYIDLGGIDKKKNPHGYLFKKRMGGEEIFHIGAFESCSNISVKMIIHTFERLFITSKRLLNKG